MVTINKIVEFLDKTELAPEDVTKLESLLDQVDLSHVPDSDISAQEWLALQNSPDFQEFLDQTFDRHYEDAQTAFASKINALFRPVNIPRPTDRQTEWKLADLTPQELSRYLDRQIDILRDNNILSSDRAQQGQFLVEQLKNEGLYLEAASLYEELAFLFARSGDGQAEQALQTEAKYWRHFDTYQDPFVASVEALKEDLSVSLQTNPFYPSQKIIEAQLALLNHDIESAKKSLKDLMEPWNATPVILIPMYLRPYLTQAKQMHDGALVQEERETTLELLMLEAKEDQFNLSDEMQHEVHTAELGSSSGFFDKYIAYPFQSAVGTLNAEGYFLKKYEGRMAFRYLLQTILVSGKAGCET